MIDVDAAGAVAIAERLRLSNAQRERLAGLASPWPIDPQADARSQRRTLYDVGSESYRDLVLLVAAGRTLSAARRRKLLDLVETWSPPQFPLAGRDVTALGIPPGPRVGQLLEQVRRWWEDGDFSADRRQCLARLNDLVSHS